VISVSVAIISTVISTVAGTGARAIAVTVTTSDCANDSSKACCLTEIFDLVDDRLAAGRLGALRVGGGIVIIVTVAVAVPSTRAVIVVVVIAAVH